MVRELAARNGFHIAGDTKLAWRDTARAWQEYEFGGAVNRDDVGLKARNRLAILETGAGSRAVLPPSPKFFFACEMETDLRYVYYRKDSGSSFAIGVRQPEREEGYKPYGVSDAVWNRQVTESRGELQNFALYNAPPTRRRSFSRARREHRNPGRLSRRLAPDRYGKGAPE